MVSSPCVSDPQRTLMFHSLEFHGPGSCHGCLPVRAPLRLHAISLSRISLVPPLHEHGDGLGNGVQFTCSLTFPSSTCLLVLSHRRLIGLSFLEPGFDLRFLLSNRLESPFKTRLERKDPPPSHPSNLYHVSSRVFCRAIVIPRQGASEMGVEWSVGLPPFDVIRPQLSTMAHEGSIRGDCTKQTMENEKKKHALGLWKWAAALVALGIGGWMRRKKGTSGPWTKEKNQRKRRNRGTDGSRVETTTFSPIEEYDTKQNKHGEVGLVQPCQRAPLVENATPYEIGRAHGWAEKDNHGKENQDQSKASNRTSLFEGEDKDHDTDLSEENSHLKNMVIKLMAKTDTLQQQLDQQEEERMKMRAALEAKESMYMTASQKVEELERELKHVGRDGDEVERVESELHAARKEMEAMKKAHADEAAKWLSEADALQQAVQAAQMALLKIMGQDSGSGTATASDSEATTSRTSRQVLSSQLGSHGTGHINNGLEDVQKRHSTVISGQS